MVSIEAYLYRDFMPGQSDDRLIAVPTLQSDSTHTLPADLRFDHAWIIHGVRASRQFIRRAE